MTFADIYLSTQDINVSELNFKVTDCYDTVTLCADRFLQPYCSNVGGKLPKCTLTDPLSHQTLSQTKILPFQSKTQRKIYFAFII
jgi:hypothetical protein